MYWTLAIAALVLLAWVGRRWPTIALAAALVCCAGAAVLGVYLESAALPAAGALAAVGGLLSLMLTRDAPDRETAAHLFARILLTLIGIGIGVLAAAMMGGFYGGAFLMLLTVLLFAALLAGRATVAARVVATLAAAMRQNLPLAPALASAAAGRTDTTARVLQTIASNLGQGLPLSHAVRLGYRACPGHVLAMIQAGERVGQLPAALAALEADLAEQAARKQRIRPIHPAYLVVIVLLAVSLLSGLGLFVLPKFWKIFDSFNAEIPASTVLLRGLVTFLAAYVMPFVALGLVTGIVLAIVTGLLPRRADYHQPLARMGDWLKWHLPVLHWFERNYSLLRTVEALRLSLRAGCTVDRAVEEAAAMDVNCRFRGRLARWLEAIRRGDDVAAAARAAGVGAALAWAFDARVNPNNAPAALEVVERGLRNAYSVGGALARYIGWPVTALAVAAMVGFAAYAMMAPLPALIRSMSAEALP